MSEGKSKLIISKTIMFMLIVGFIILFKTIFGAENTLIGVTTITAALLFLERNLTTRKVKNLVELIIINIGLGILAYLGGLTPLLALICNFIAMFFIGYIFSYNIRSNMYVPFGLQYVFMLATPIEFSGMYKRILSLIFGAIFIMIIQIIVNKNKVKKEGTMALKKLFALTRKILVEEDINKLKVLNEKFTQTSWSLKETIYTSKRENFYIKDNEKAILDIILFLRNIQNEKDKIKNNVAYLNGLKEIEECIEKDKEEKFLLEVEDIDRNLNLKIIFDLLNKVKSSDKEVFKIETPKEFKRINIIKRYLNKDSMRFRYAFRIGMSIAITSFAIKYLDIFQGKWILFTVFALIQPYTEHSVEKTKQRAQGTVIGALIALILFTIFQNKTLQMVIMIGAGYLDSYHRTYREKMVYVTISAVGASLVMGGTTKMILTRIILVFIGVLISILCNKFVLPYSIEDAKRELINMYKVNSDRMVKEIEEGNKNGVLENHYIIASLIEKKLSSFNLSDSIKEHKNYVLREYFNFKKDILV